MKQPTPLERSKLQLTMIARLHDVFADIKDEVEITPEYIQETLGQFMQVATGSDYPFSKSVRIGFGDLVQAQPQVQVQSVVDSVEKALNGTMSKTSDKLLHNTEKTLQEVLSFVRNTFESKLFEFNQQHLLNTEGVSSFPSVGGVGELKIFKHGIYVGAITFEFADQ
ncbi:hypothetical protein [Xenorhabdus thuongxuanensis]|uniref:hypothetical protein n=1 Tax=Xenorhabdus thuongxuanensis TaxID=1873484 RepID=UPI0039F02593